MSLQWALQSQVWANPSLLQIFICTEHSPECQAFVNPSAHSEMLGPQVVTVSLSSCFLARSWQPVPAPHQGQRGKQRKASCFFSLGVVGGRGSREEPLGLWQEERSPQPRRDQPSMRQSLAVLLSHTTPSTHTPSRHCVTPQQTHTHAQHYTAPQQIHTIPNTHNTNTPNTTRHYTTPHTHDTLNTT